MVVVILFCWHKKSVVYNGYEGIIEATGKPGSGCYVQKFNYGDNYFPPV